MPERLQRRRTAGWTAPLDSEGRRPVYVGRGSRFGNPFAVGALYANRTAFHDAPVVARDGREEGVHEHAALFGWPAWTETIAPVRDRAHAVELFRAHVAYFDDNWDPEVIRRDLAGRNLMCWCPANQPCHADVLLGLANFTVVGGEA